MEKITKIDAERAVREGVETSRLRRQLARAEQERTELANENVRLRAIVRIHRDIIRRNNQQVIAKHKAMREFREEERKESRGNAIDAFLLGMGFGVMIAFGVASWVVASA